MYHKMGPEPTSEQKPSVAGRGKSRLERRPPFTSVLKDSELMREPVRFLTPSFRRRPESRRAFGHTGNPAEQLTPLGSGFRRNDARGAIFVCIPSP